MHRRAPRLPAIALALLALPLLLPAPAARAESYYVLGSITGITYMDDTVLVQLSSGVPGNCAGTPYGWMRVPPSNRAMIAFVTGLWMRGDAASVTVVLYTSGIDGSGYCAITQLDPPG
jgi:hypothetical protein